MSSSQPQPQPPPFPNPSHQPTHPFHTHFLHNFTPLHHQVLQSYTPTLTTYKTTLIPFQLKRMKQNQSLSFKNTALQRTKLQLMKQIQQLSRTTHNDQQQLQHQSSKINDLEHTVLDLETACADNLSEIEALQIYNKELEASLQEKVGIVRQVELDKAQVGRNYELRAKEYDGLMETCVRDKEVIREKFGYIEELENGLVEKQRQLEQRQFYLKKQRQKLQQQKKQLQPKPHPQKKPSLPQQQPHISKRNSIYQQPQQPQQPPNSKNPTRNEILRTPTKKLIKHHNNQIYDLCFNYTGNLIATCGGDRMIKLYDVMSLRSGVTIVGKGVDDICLCLGLDYSGERLLVGSVDRSVGIYGTGSGKLLHSFMGHGYKVNSVSWTSAKEKCVSGSEDKQIKVWQIEKASNILSIPCGKPVRYLTCNTVQPLIYSGHSDGSIRIYSLTQSSTPISQLKGLIDYPITSLSILSNRSQVLASSQQGSPIYLLDLKMNKILTRYEGKEFFNTNARAELSPTQKYVLAGNCDGYVFYWDRERGGLEKCVSGHDAAVTTLKYHFMSGVMVSCDKDGNVIVWQ